ncbi:MAG TPA: hypothetical protein VL095_02980 [Flavisolibacter sp.]|nr:hypothetical protein [Flavisolibacter sp.]
MKKISLIILLFSLFQTTVVASSSLPGTTPDPKANEVMIPLVGTSKLISLADYLNLTPQAYKQLTGKKLKLGQKIDLGVSKHFIKKMIRKDGTVDVQQMKKKGFFSGWQWHWGGFALGFFFSLLGVIATLFFNDDYKWDRFWTALHTSIWLWLIAVIVVAAISGGTY